MFRDFTRPSKRLFNRILRFKLVLIFAVFPLCGCGWFSSTEPEAMQAVKTAEAIAQGITAGQSRAVWDGLSDSHQEDVNQLVHRLAWKLPPVMWAHGFRLLELWGRALKEKREFALRCPSLEKGHAQLEKHGEPFAAFLLKLSESDFRDIEKLKTADVGDLLSQIDPEFLNAVPALVKFASTGAAPGFSGEAYKAVRKSIASASFALGEHNEGRATIHAPYGEGQVVHFELVKSSDRWVVKLPDDDWQNAMASANAWVDDLDEEKLRSFAFLGGMVSAAVTAQLEEVLNAQTQAEFDTLLADPSFLMVRSLFFSAPPNFIPPDKP